MRVTSTGVCGAIRYAYSPRHHDPTYRGTSLIRNCFLLGPYSRTVPRAIC